MSDPVKKHKTPAILDTTQDLRAFVNNARTAQKSIALVPTMGALHDGHMSLVETALQTAHIVIVSIFVNPTQFAEGEDLDAYPRTWDLDFQKLKDAGAHGVFRPEVNEIYPDGFSTTVHVSGVSGPLEGEKRPGHFDGVATIVTKLLLQSLPDYAVFGEKDYQQLRVIRRLVADLDIPVDIIGAPTVREEDGLALSSRNRYLTDKERTIAPALNRTLAKVARKIRDGNKNFKDLETWACSELEKAGFNAVDYVAIRNAKTLQTPEAPDEPLRILAAAQLGKARLIDNRAP